MSSDWTCVLELLTKRHFQLTKNYLYFFPWYSWVEKNNRWLSSWVAVCIIYWLQTLNLLTVDCLIQTVERRVGGDRLQEFTSRMRFRRCGARNGTNYVHLLPIHVLFYENFILRPQHVVELSSCMHVCIRTFQNIVYALLEKGEKLNV